MLHIAINVILKDMAVEGLVGLGNIGKEYEHTYHNIGAWSLPLLARAAADDGFEEVLRFKGPSGYMNESGPAIKEWLAYNNLALDRMIVIHDDSDLEIGTYKLVRGGGSAGHKGIESLVQHLGTKDFWRLRIGIRVPNEPVRKKALDFVLDRFPDSLETEFEQVFKKAWADVKTLLLL